MTTKPALQKIPQGILHTEDKSKQHHKMMGSIKTQEKKRQIIRVALIQLHTIKSLNNKNN
jgi:hypothetical protein